MEDSGSFDTYSICVGTAKMEGEMSCDDLRDKVNPKFE